jgi:hypothetical protein
MAGHVGGGLDVRLVAGDEMPVAGHHEIGFDEVGAELDANRIVLECVVGEIGGGTAAMPDDERRLEAVAPGVGERRRSHEADQAIRTSRLRGSGRVAATMRMRSASFEVAWD